MEDRVNNFLRQVAAGAGEITIRVVSSTEKVLDTKPGIREMFPDFSEKFPYKTKTILAFEELDGVDVCFFGMHVQEYPSECPPPNKRYVLVTTRSPCRIAFTARDPRARSARGRVQ